MAETDDAEKRDTVLRRMLATPKRVEAPKVTSHVLTHDERETRKRVMASERQPASQTAHGPASSNAPSFPQTADVIRSELAKARAALDGVNASFNDYSGNNPRKYQKEIQRAARLVRHFEAELEKLPEQGDVVP